MPRTSQQELDALRRQVLLLTRRTSAKISRLSKQGIFIARDPSLDPRRTQAVISRMTRKQLESLSERLQTFNSRSTKFVPGAGGAPIPLPVASQYRQQQELFNLSRQRRAHRFARAQTGLGKTVLDERRYAGTPQEMNGSFALDNVPITQIQSARAAQSMVGQFQRRMRPGAATEEGRVAHRHLMDLAKLSGSKEVLDAVASLTPEQALIANSSEEFMRSLQNQVGSPPGEVDMETGEIEESTLFPRIDILKATVK